MIVKNNDCTTISITGICDYSAPQFLASTFMPSFLFALFSYCSDIDECSSGSHNCSNHATCINTAGHFNCSCKAGYTGDGHVCLGTISSFRSYNKIYLHSANDSMNDIKKRFTIKKINLNKSSQNVISFTS